MPRARPRGQHGLSNWCGLPGRFGVGLLSASLLVGSYAVYRAIRPQVLRALTPSDRAPAPLIRPDAAH